jgi:hypothetical protein
MNPPRSSSRTSAPISATLTDMTSIADTAQQTYTMVTTAPVSGQKRPESR